MKLFPTPYYLIDEIKLRHNLKLIRRVQETSGAKSLLALKCFATWGVFELMQQYLDGTSFKIGLDDFIISFELPPLQSWVGGWG